VSGGDGRCEFADERGNRCGRAARHDPSVLRHLFVDADGRPVARRPAGRPSPWSDGGTPPTCEECGKRPAEIRSFRRTTHPVWGTPVASHGPVCFPCLITLRLAIRSCPPRRTEDPAVLDRRSAEADIRASREARTSRAFRAAEDAILSSVGGLPGLVAALVPAVQTASLRGPERWWLFEFLEPEIAEYLDLFHNTANTAARQTRADRDAAGDARWRAEQARRGILDLDNPFEDPDFLDRVLSESGDRCGPAD
jgi:hypothetical protein